MPGAVITAKSSENLSKPNSALMEKRKSRVQSPPTSPQNSRKQLQTREGRPGLSTRSSKESRGLGITAPAQARLQGRSLSAYLKASFVEVEEVYIDRTANPAPPMARFAERILSRAHTEESNLLKNQAIAEFDARMNEDSRSSGDSAGTVSTDPITPAISDGSTSPGALSQRSPVHSAPTTPSDSRPPSPQNQLATDQQNVEGVLNRRRTLSSLTFGKWSLSRKGSPNQSSTDISEKDPNKSSEDKHRGTFRKRPALSRMRSASPTKEHTKNVTTKNDTSPKLTQAKTTSAPELCLDNILPSPSPLLHSSNPASPLLSLSPTEWVKSNETSTPKKRDDLWNAFRSLEIDFAKFTSKPIGLKVNIVRSSLLPFLRKYATHPSNRNLQVEDLDRRVTTLNKWWTAVIELLNGSNHQSITAAERPIILDAISYLMSRPEWRPAGSPLCPLKEQEKVAANEQDHWERPIASTGPDIVAESVHNNIRNIFVENLTALMASAVDKMSQRFAPPGLVNFCGKACAYAFFFVPGVADTLVRLWDLQIEPLRRILRDHQINGFQDMSSTTESLKLGFPPALHQLGFSSLRKYMRQLRSSAQAPVGLEEIKWQGPWLDRWSGRESDLFYVFVKHFQFLVVQFMPPLLAKKEQICAPALLVVRGQLLKILDSINHRQSCSGPQTHAQKPTFDELVTDPVAVAPALPVPSSKVIRSMGETRMVTLIRDFLSDNAPEQSMARQFFAESISDLLQTAARGCSLFDHAACYTLLDLSEEIFLILTRFETRQLQTNGTLINVDFWIGVWKKMIESQNTMTEIRLYSFLYTIWKTVICGSGLQRSICLEFLLDSEIFESRFNHWCPTVRAYFMRLLCWRVAKQDGENSAVGTEVLEKLAANLKSSWSRYSSALESAEKSGRTCPATNPCYPVPSRRLRIVRTDVPLIRSHVSVPVESVMSPQSGAHLTPSALKKNPMFEEVVLDSRPNSWLSDSDQEAEQRGRGIGDLMRGWMGTKSRSKSQILSRPQSQLSQDFQPVATLPTASQDAFSTVKRSDLVPEEIQQNSATFKFALDYQPNPAPLPRMRLSSPRLPAPALSLLAGHSLQLTEAGDESTETRKPHEAHTKYYGHALAEWTILLGECQAFFERRKKEGMMHDQFVETPMLGVEVLRRL